MRPHPPRRGGNFCHQAARREAQKPFAADDLFSSILGRARGRRLPWVRSKPVAHPRSKGRGAGWGHHAVHELLSTSMCPSSHTRRPPPSYIFGQIEGRTRHDSDFRQHRDRDLFNHADSAHAGVGIHTRVGPRTCGCDPRDRSTPSVVQTKGSGYPKNSNCVFVQIINLILAARRLRRGWIPPPLDQR